LHWQEVAAEEKAQKAPPPPEKPKKKIPPVPMPKVSQNGLFEPFIYNNEHFTKTGSG
jgi:hypothetical protein